MAFSAPPSLGSRLGGIVSLAVAAWLMLWPVHVELFAPAHYPTTTVNIDCGSGWSQDGADAADIGSDVDMWVAEFERDGGITNLGESAEQWYAQYCDNKIRTRKVWAGVLGVPGATLLWWHYYARRKHVEWRRENIPE
ncbi:hypothetical protein [Haloechinothrix salitolerans]|uniref:Transmembrane protein n=1 Tax=Haloechinothrix salitolerans TaxID=926830 RepID=A0ABW2C8A2_9PSEU